MLSAVWARARSRVDSLRTARHLVASCLGNRSVVVIWMLAVVHSKNATVAERSLLTMLALATDRHADHGSGCKAGLFDGVVVRDDDVCGVMVLWRACRDGVGIDEGDGE